MNNSYLVKSCLTAMLLLLCGGFSSVTLGIDKPLQEELLKGLSYRLVGPMRGGRATRVAGISGDAATYYFGTPAGGVWKTEDGGITWAPIFDGQKVGAIGDITIADADPSIIYVGTGDAKSRGNDSHGNGVYKSIDAGASWQHMGLPKTMHISRIVIHPQNPDIVFVAALGRYYGPNEERGIYRSLDGGKSWKKVLYVDAKTSAYDVTFVPGNPQVLYASMWQMVRKPYSLESGGPGSGLYRSTDGGASWQEVKGNGLPTGILGKIGITVSPADPSRIYAVIEADKGGLYRSDDAGKNWTHVNASRSLWRRAWFFMDIIAHPTDADTVFVMNIQLEKSVDGGKSFTPMKIYHVDHHDLWLDPKNPLRMISGNDGGANVSVNGGKGWTRSDDNQPTGQFYRVTTDNRFPYYIYGGQQDWETIAIASRGNWNGIGYRDWYPVGGCEMGWAAPDKRTANFVYAGCTDGGISRYDRRTQRNQSVDPWPRTNIGHGAKDAKFRFQWTSPMLISSHDPSVLYSGANVLFKSTDDGMSWEQLSEDLTRNDKSKQEASGGPFNKDNVGTEVYGTIYALAESSLSKDVLWVGSDDGLVHVSRNGGKKWQNVTPPKNILPEWSRVNSIEASRHDAGTAYVSVHRREWNEYGAFIYKTTNYGKNWSLITKGLPADTIARVIREDSQRKGLLFLGTEMGIYLSINGGADWQALQLNLPVTPIYDLTIKDNDLVVATHGRAFWVLDDISPLRTLTAELLAAPAHLYEPAATIRVRDDFVVPNTPMGQNPPPGAVIYYSLGKLPKGPVELSIVDSKGQVVRQFTTELDASDSMEPPLVDDMGADFSRSSSLSTEPGLHRFVWDLRLPGAQGIPGSIVFWHPPKTPPVGPLALPGSYTVRIKVDDTSITSKLKIEADPRIAFPLQELEKQFDLHTKMLATMSEISAAVATIRNLYTQIDKLGEAAANGGKSASLKTDLEGLREKLREVEYSLTEPRMQGASDAFHFPIRLDNQLGILIGTVANSDRAPTRQAHEVYEVLLMKITEQFDNLEQHLTSGLGNVNRKAATLGLQPILLNTL